MKLSLPLSVTLPRKKGDRKWILNQNNYRNTHYITLNKVKHFYEQLVVYAIGMAEFDDGAVISEAIGKPPYIFTYTLYPESNRRMDVANVCSVVDKFTCDTLVELDIIPDDNHKIIPAINYRFGKVDRENPRVELCIEEYR